MSLNKVMLIGRLGKEPEFKELANNQVCNFSIATNKIYKDNAGNKVDKTVWHNIVVWGKNAFNCNSYLKKGSLVFIEGELDYQNYEDQNGVKKLAVKIVARNVHFLDNIKNVKESGKSTDVSMPDFDATFSDEIPF